ncbi:unnamed protein product [Phaedon cochleariae]|uniref:Meckel syndrome type 1 protein n=1 Tax=Phaedon cochleariae TaxID=80249 RepID=A0A9P0DMS1_PHACE|nr:unnamed protein product [Phaedon cochleariae]
MYNYSSCNMETKYTGYYRCSDNISNFKIRLKLRVEDPDKSSNIKKQEEWHIQEFSWQEKQFSRIERQFYAEINNCVTDLEKIYHDKINAEDFNENSIFHTYPDIDGYIQDQDRFRKQISHLEKLVEEVRLNDETETRTNNEYDYKESVLSSLGNKIIYSNFENMFIFADLGDYIEDIWMENQQLLCELKFDKISKVLSVYPDFTHSQSYHKKIQGGKNIHYYIENCSPRIEESEEIRENEIAKTIHDCKLSLTREIISDKFFLPPKNKLNVYIFFEILSGRGFEYSDVYVQYRVDLPSHWSCEDPNTLHGVTQTCIGYNQDGLSHFGHDFEIILEYDIQNLQEKSIPETPHIYFEIISKSSWDRYRTEGLTYTSLPVSSPGCHNYTLSCFRFDTKGQSGRMRRFFIGDSYNYKDVRWIGLPSGTEQSNIFNKYGVNTIGTGQIDVRMNILHQSQAFLHEFKEGDSKDAHIYEKLNASSLIRSVNQVLKAFKKARRHMIEVKKDVASVK